MITKTNRKENCEEKIFLEDLFYGVYLDNKEKKLKLFDCYKKQNSDFKLRQNKIKFTDKSKDILKLFNSIISFKYDLEQAHAYVQKLRGFNNILARLLEAYLFMISGNHARAELIFSKIMQKEFIYHTFNSDIPLLSLNKQIRCTVDILKKFENDISREKLFENLLSYLFLNSQGEFKVQLDKNFKIIRGLRDIRKKYQSVQYGKNYPFVWGQYVFENTSQFEYVNFIESTSVKETIFKGQSSSLLFFRSIQGIETKYKEKIIKQYIHLFEHNDIYYKTILFRILEDNLFYTFINTHSKVKIGLMANNKRIFFRKQLKNKYNVFYSILNLMALGDIDINDILKITALKNAQI